MSTLTESTRSWNTNQDQHSSVDCGNLFFHFRIILENNLQPPMHLSFIPSINFCNVFHDVCVVHLLLSWMNEGWYLMKILCETDRKRAFCPIVGASSSESCASPCAGFSLEPQYNHMESQKLWQDFHFVYNIQSHMRFCKQNNFRNIDC